MSAAALDTSSSRRRAWVVTLVAVLAGLLISGVLVWRASYSAFTSTTSNNGNSWQTGSVTIDDNDGGTALFNVTAMKPGQSGSRCIRVRSQGNLPATVKLYGTGYSQVNNVGDNLNLVITQGSGTAANCGDFTPAGSGSSVLASTPLTTFASNHSDFTNGTGAWSVAGTPPEYRTFKFDYTFDVNAPNTTQNGSASIGFTWEAQNT